MGASKNIIYIMYCAWRHCKKKCKTQLNMRFEPYYLHCHRKLHNKTSVATCSCCLSWSLKLVLFDGGIFWIHCLYFNGLRAQLRGQIVTLSHTLVCSHYQEDKNRIPPGPARGKRKPPLLSPKLKINSTHK